MDGAYQSRTPSQPKVEIFSIILWVLPHYHCRRHLSNRYDANDIREETITNTLLGDETQTVHTFFWDDLFIHCSLSKAHIVRAAREYNITGVFYMINFLSRF